MGDEAIITADELTSVEFGTTRISDGYDIEQVDEFVKQARRALLVPADGPQEMTAADVSDVRFRTSLMRESYNLDEVDAVLDRVEAELARRAALQSAPD